MHSCKTKVMDSLRSKSLGGDVAELQLRLLLTDPIGAESCVAGFSTHPATVFTGSLYLPVNREPSYYYCVFDK